MNILLVSGSYPPEIRSASDLMYELAGELKLRGHNVTVITSWPQYNLTTDAKQRKFEEVSIEGDIRIIRIKSLPHHNVHFILRGIAQLLLPYFFIARLKKLLNSEIEAVVVYSPPLTLANVGAWVKKHKKSRYLLNIQDLFPQNAIDLGVLKNPLQIALFRAIEGKAYSSADVITAHSKGNRKMLVDAYPGVADKVVTLHNWVDIAHHAGRATSVDFREKFGLQDKFVAVFAGVIGISQNIDQILEIAKKMSDHKDFMILIVGDGSEKSRLQERCNAEGINNVIFKPFISREQYPDLLKAVDAGIVSLSPKNKTPVVPGKILGYMAAALPVIAFLNRESDGHDIINEAQCGISTPSDDFDGMVQAFQTLYGQRAELGQMGANGRTYVTNHLSKEKCVNELLDALNKPGRSETIDPKRRTLA